MKQHLFFMLLLFLAVPAAATAQEFILYEDFESTVAPSLPQGWLVENPPGDLGTWEVRNFGGLRIEGITSSPVCVRYTGTADPADDWLFSKGINLAVGTQYTLSFWCRATSAALPERMDVFLSASQSAAGPLTPIWLDNNIIDTSYREVVVPFTATASGVYYLGFHCFSEPSHSNLYLDDILVTAPFTGLELTLGTMKGYLGQGSSTFSRDSVIDCLVYLKNVSPLPITVNGLLSVGHVNNPEVSLGFIVCNAAGDTLGFNGEYDAPEPSGEDFVQLQPSEYVFKIYNLNWGAFKLDPGPYTIRAVYTNYYEETGLNVWRGRIVSNPISITVE